MLSEKVEHSKAEYEHPAKGINHCSECEHFQSPSGCEIVKSPVNRDGWCAFFEDSYVQT